MRRILSVTLENRPGALSRVVSMFTARAFNIDSLTVAETEDPTLSRMTIVTHGDDDVIEQIIKQINKIIDVNTVTDITEKAHVERELLMVKVRADTGDVRQEMHRLVSIFRARINDVSDKGFIIEVTGTGHKLDAFLDALPGNCIIETVRTGVAGVTRGR